MLTVTDSRYLRVSRGIKAAWRAGLRGSDTDENTAGEVEPTSTTRAG
jgi:hypothetical protein